MNSEYQDVTIVTLDKGHIIRVTIINILLFPVFLFMAWLGYTGPKPHPYSMDGGVAGFLMSIGVFGTYAGIRLIWAAVLNYFDHAKGLLFCRAGLIYRIAVHSEEIIEWPEILAVRFCYHEKNPLLIVHVRDTEKVTNLLKQQGDNPEVKDALYGSPMVIDTHRLDMSNLQLEETFNRYIKKYSTI